MTKNNGWNEYEKLVLSELTDLKVSVATLNVAVSKVSTRVSVVEVKAGVWGALAGLVVSLPIAFEVLRHIR